MLFVKHSYGGAAECIVLFVGEGLAPPEASLYSREPLDAGDHEGCPYGRTDCHGPFGASQ